MDLSRQDGAVSAPGHACVAQPLVLMAADVDGGQALGLGYAGAPLGGDVLFTHQIAAFIQSGLLLDPMSGS